MDALTKELQSFLVRMSYGADGISYEVEHYIEHLMRLLPVDEEEAILHYFGILGHGREALSDLAKERGMTPEALMEQIDNNLRRLAVTPEWQLIRQLNR